MPTIFQQAAGKAWSPMELDGHAEGELGGRTPDALRELGVEILSVPHGTPAGMTLLVRQGIDARVNGETVPGLIRALNHRDEIAVGGQRFFFSAESPPEVVVYRASENSRPLRCPVCRCPIEEGQSVVRCPGPNCARIYHEMEASGDRRAKRCWTYDRQCRFCSHPTSLSGALVWVPERERIDE